MSAPLPDVSGRSLAELWSLQGRVAVVTGAARGIGAATARRLAESGATVVLTDRDGAAATAQAEALGREFGTTAVAAALDVTDPDAAMDLAAAVAGEHGRLDVWVNNAGVYPNQEFLGHDLGLWNDVQRINSTGAFLGARAAATQMAAAGTGGTIVNVASTAGIRAGGIGYGAYTASKHAVVGLTKALSAELGPLGIRAVGVAPGIIATEGMAETMEADGGAAFRAFAANLPSGRGGVPDDIARTVVFLASDMAMFLTGTTLVIDGGHTAR